MPDWLHNSFVSESDAPLSQIVTRQAFAFAFGCVVAGVYRLSHGKPGNQSREMMATLVLLTVLISMMTAVIGDNIARAFSIVGALSIVRFRTVVEDRRDTAFVIFAVAVGMAAGAGHMLIPVVTIPIVAVAAHLFRPRDERIAASNAAAFTLVVRVGTAFAGDAGLQRVFDTHLAVHRLDAMATSRQGAAFEKTFAVQLRDAASIPSLVADLSAVDGVQNVDLRRA